MQAWLDAQSCDHWTRSTEVALPASMSGCAVIEQALQDVPGLDVSFGVMAGF